MKDIEIYTHIMGLQDQIRDLIDITKILKERIIALEEIEHKGEL